MWIAGVLLSLSVVQADEAQLIKKGSAIAAKARILLLSRLQKELAISPVKAIGVCQTEAPAIGKIVSEQNGNIKLGRTSSRVRNPNNQPAPWMLSVLKEFEESKSKALPGKIVTLGDNRRVYVEPIYVQPLCLICHGEVISPDIQHELKIRYPMDQAKGYKAGDFRGLFWVLFEG